MSDMTPEQVERTLRQRAADRIADSQHVEKKSPGGGSMLKVLADENTAMADTVRRMRELIDAATCGAGRAADTNGQARTVPCSPAGRPVAARR